MPCIRVGKDGPLYEAECFYEDGMVTVFGIKDGQSNVDLNGMTETTAARTILRDPIRESKVDPLSE